MSTSSKIIENHIDSAKNTPKKSLNLSSSPHLTPRSRDSSSSQCSSIDREQLLKLQIKQLKRENKFLKKKISDLVAQLNVEKPKKKVANKGAEKQDKDITHASIDFFFQQINSLIKSLNELFKIEFSRAEIEEFNNRFPEEDEMEPTKKFVALKKFAINRKLQKVLLESDEKRYPLLLEVFTTYYRAKQESDQHVRKVVDSLTAKAQSLSRIILNKAQKRSSLKTSIARSHQGIQPEDKKINMNNLNLAWTFNRISSAGSQTGQDPHKKRNEFGR